MICGQSGVGWILCIFHSFWNKSACTACMYECTCAYSNLSGSKLEWVLSSKTIAHEKLNNEINI